MAGKTVKIIGFGTNVSLAEMTTDASGHATKTVTLSGGMALWLARPLYASFGGDATTPVCISGSVNPMLDVF